MKRKILLITVVLAAAFSLSAVDPNPAVSWSLIAGTWENQNPSVETNIFPQMAAGRMVWGDYNNDGFLDAFVVGGQTNHDHGQARLYKNNGNNTFSEDQAATFGTRALYQASAVFIDYNNDGYLDLIIVGRTKDSGNGKVFVYKNGGPGSYGFVLDSDNSSQLTGIKYDKNENTSRMLAAVDFDHDGWTDLVMCGSKGVQTDNTWRSTAFYKNNEGMFERKTNIVEGNDFDQVSGGSIHVGDVNEDGYADIFAVGWSDYSNGYRANLYINGGDGTFNNSSYNNFSAREECETILVDVNGDGFADIVEITRAVANIYINNGSGTSFDKKEGNETGLLTADGAGITAGDINNDGLMDIIVTGRNENGAQLNNSTKIFYNKGDGTFTSTDVDQEMRVRSGNASLVDIDNDGNLDYSNFGYGNGWTTAFAKNDLAAGIPANTAPSVPTSFTVQYDDVNNKFDLSWTASSDDITLQSALRYNIYAIDNETGKIYAYAPVDIVTGKLRISGDIVPLIAQTSFELNLPEGSYSFGVQAVDQSDVASRFATYNYPDPDVLTWTGGGDDSDWYNTVNWDNTLDPPAPYRFPATNSKITISGNLSYYPVLQAETSVKEITFQPGAEIGRQDLLTYDKAFVQYDFSDPDLRDRWNMLSMPLQEEYSGDFTFGGYPVTYVRTFAVQTVDQVQYAGWVPNKGNDTKFTAGTGFALWVNNTNYTDGKGLGSASGIIELPFYENDPVVDAGLHYTHGYTGTDGVGISSFYNFKTDGNGGYERSTTTPVTVNRTLDAYKLAESPVTETLTFVEDLNYISTSDFALAGNPFMTTIDFTKLVDANPNVISDTYLIWSGKGIDNASPGGFLGYNVDGSYGIQSEDLIDEIDEYIAPLQSFIVVKGTAGGTTLDFNLADISADATGTLKSTTASANKIEIVASNETASVLTFIANREYGDNMLCSKDGRKLLSGLSNVPEVYTLKQTSNDGKAAVGANIINLNNSISIPVGLATAYAGEMTLTFSGMADYAAYNIQLSDLKADGGSAVIDLTGKTDFTYPFTYTPPTDKNDDTEIIPDNERFVLLFSPKSITGIGSTNDLEQVLVYFRDNTLYAVSAANDLIRQLHIYDMQGQLLYAADNIEAPVYTAAGIYATSGVYMARLTTEKGVKSVKLFVR